MPKIHGYYEDLMKHHYGNHLEMCSELGLDPKEIYTHELTEEDWF